MESGSTAVQPIKKAPKSQGLSKSFLDTNIKYTHEYVQTGRQTNRKIGILLCL